MLVVGYHLYLTAATIFSGMFELAIITVSVDACCGVSTVLMCVFLTPKCLTTVEVIVYYRFLAVDSGLISDFCTNFGYFGWHDIKYACIFVTLSRFG
eukprot:gene2773-1758_t